VQEPLGPELLRQVATDPRVPEGWRRGAERALAREG